MTFAPRAIVEAELVLQQMLRQRGDREGLPVYATAAEVPAWVCEWQDADGNYHWQLALALPPDPMKEPTS